MNRHYCAICRDTIDMSTRHVEVEAETLGEDAPEYESYLFHLSCWDSIASGWGQP
jgi:hypothetical protein